jgi:hypothetical protein
MFGNGICKIRGNTTMNGLSGSSSKFTMALGGVSCTFRRELRPYEPYDLWTKIVAWDEKWIYMMTHFVKKGARIQPQELTLYPKQRHLGEKSRGSGQRRKEAADAHGKGPVAATAVSKIVFKDGRKTIAPMQILELSGLVPTRGGKDSATGPSKSDWTWEKMEAERLRGLETVRHLAQQSPLEDEFTHDVALGRHYDGYGIEGVVSTLAQLGGISRYQLL